MTNPKKVGAMQTKANIKPFKSSKKAWVAIKNGVVYVYQKEKVNDLHPPNEEVLKAGPVSVLMLHISTYVCIRTSRKACQLWR